MIHFVRIIPNKSLTFVSFEASVRKRFGILKQLTVQCAHLMDSFSDLLKFYPFLLQSFVYLHFLV